MEKRCSRCREVKPLDEFKKHCRQCRQCRLTYTREYIQREDVKARQKANGKKWRDKPEVRQKIKEYKKEYQQRDDVRERNNARLREERKANNNAHLKTPAYKQWLKRKGKNGAGAVQQRIKLHYGCMNGNCKWVGDFEAFCLDFHHVDPSTKLKPVSQINSIPAVIAEINKCVVLCANCHRMETWGTLDCSNFPTCNVSDEGEILD